MEQEYKYFVKYTKSKMWFMITVKLMIKFCDINAVQPGFFTAISILLGKFAVLLGNFNFQRFSVFYVQIIIWIIKLSSKTAKLPSKLRIANILSQL